MAEVGSTVESPRLGDGASDLGGLLSRPLRDVLAAMDRVLVGVPSLLAMAAGLAVGWWLYVPLHELLHAAACLATGGQVSRLEIAPIYGGTLLEGWIPFVAAGGEYAGRLSGFDTGGSRWVYLATDLGPFVLTLFPGVWALRAAARRGRSLAVAFLFAAVLPLALAPFLSLTGDAFEIGGLAISPLASTWYGSDVGLPSDDLVRWIEQANGRHTAGWLAAATAMVIGLGWSVATYHLGHLIAGLLGQPPLGQSAPDSTTGERRETRQGEADERRSSQPG